MIFSWPLRVTNFGKPCTYVSDILKSILLVERSIYISWPPWNMTRNAVLSAYNIHKKISSTANPVIRKNTEFLICYCYNVSGNIVLQTKIIFQLHDV